MALTEKRLEMMRQITKGIKAETVQVYLIVDMMSRETFGVYTSEDVAWELAGQIFDLYEIDCDVITMDLDADCLAHRRVG